MKPRAGLGASFFALVLVLPTAAVSATTPVSTQTVTSVELLGEVAFPTGMMFAGTEVGGLSSITYDADRRLFFALSDDRAELGPVRYYTMRIGLRDGSLDDGDVRFLRVTELLDLGGVPFAPGSVDPEGFTLTWRGQFFMSSEGDSSKGIDPFIRRYNPRGRVTSELPVADRYLPTVDSGVRTNLAFESLAMTPDGSTLVTGAEGALLQDGPASTVTDGSVIRIATYGLPTQTAGPEYAYELGPIPEEPDPAGAFAVTGLVELLPLDDAGTMLAMERAFSVGKGNTVTIYEISTAGASDISVYDDLYDELTDTYVEFDPVTKQMVVDVAELGLVPDNIEGMTLGPRLQDGRATLVLVSDNNFNATQVTQFIVLAIEMEPTE